MAVKSSLTNRPIRGPLLANPLFLLHNKNDKLLKTLETILHIAIDFVTMNDYILYIRLIKEIKKCLSIADKAHSRA